MLDDPGVLTALVRRNAVCSDLNTRSESKLKRWFDTVRMAFDGIKPRYWQDDVRYVDFASYVGFTVDCELSRNEFNTPEKVEVAVCLSRFAPEALLYVPVGCSVYPAVDLFASTPSTELVQHIERILLQLEYDTLPSSLLRRQLPKSVPSIDDCWIHDGPCNLVLHALFNDSD